MKAVELFVIAFVLNILLSMMGRARNRNNLTYHAILVLLANFLSIFFIKEMMTLETSMLVISSIGSSIGSIFGQKISMTIESKINAKSDDHIK